MLGMPGADGGSAAARERQEAERQVEFQRAAAAALPEIHAAIGRANAGAAPTPQARFAVASMDHRWGGGRSYHLLDARTGCLWTVRDGRARALAALAPESVSPASCLDAATPSTVSAPAPPACSKLASVPGSPVEVRVGMGPPCEILPAPKAP